MSISFVALDFETANSNRASVCEVGLYKVIDGEQSGVFSSLVLPPKSVGQFGWGGMSAFTESRSLMFVLPLSGGTSGQRLGISLATYQ